MLHTLLGYISPKPAIDLEKRHHQLSAICLESVVHHLAKHDNPIPRTVRELAGVALRLDHFSCGPFAKTVLAACENEGLKNIQWHSFGTHYAVFDQVLDLCLDAANPFGYKKQHVHDKIHITGGMESDIYEKVDQLEAAISAMAKNNSRIASWITTNFEQ